MASEVDICNLALAHLGDTANITSINPPDQSMQAVQCARFYPIARDSLLEMYSWGFATKRALLPLTANTVSGWQYIYEVPNDCVSPQVVISVDAQDDWSVPVVVPNVMPLAMHNGQGIYQPQPYRLGTDATGARLLYTNLQDAVLIYTAIVTDPTKFSPLFTETLAVYLASKLAGPIIKGQEGRQVAVQLMQQMQQMYSRATESDANQQRTDIKHSVSWLVNR